MKKVTESESVSFSVISASLQPMDLALQAALSKGFSSKNIGVGCHSLLQGISLIQESKLGLLHLRQILYQMSHKGSLKKAIRSLQKTIGIPSKREVSTGHDYQ